MKKSDMLPVIAALIIALLVIPIGAVNAATPNTSYSVASVVTIPEDDLKRNTGVMVLGLDPQYNWGYIYRQKSWFTDSLCLQPITPTELGGRILVGPELIVGGEPMTDPSAPSIWAPLGTVVYYQKVGDVCFKHYFTPPWPEAKGYGVGSDLLSQHKILATLNGVPTTPTYVLCEVVEKEKAKIPPPSSKSPSKRQFSDEILKTTLEDVSEHFICKFRWIKPGVGALDVYFVGPRVYNFIADHMVIVTVGYKVGRTTVWASELQDICILGWSMDSNVLAIALFENPGISTFPAGMEVYYSWPDAMYKFVSCDEAAAWQRTYFGGAIGGWPYSEN